MYSLKKQNNFARRGAVSTAHGDFQTPCFMPIATQGSVKSLSSADVRELGAQIILANTYHLLLRVGSDAMKGLGGLHAFMRWDGPILTDSGGYQVFSLSKINSIDDGGVNFQSHIDGRRVRLTPEGSMSMQSSIGSDIIMQFDDVASGKSTKEKYKEAMERSLRWALACKNSYNHSQKLFGIVQGGTHEDLREISALGLIDIGFDGYAIGGLSVGESRNDAFRITKNLCKILPTHAPRYFMGGGMPEEIIYYVSVGVDMFDCVLPTRNARHGSLFIWKKDPKEAVREAFLLAQEGADDSRIKNALYETIHINSSQYIHDMSSIDAHSDCPTSKTYTRAYLCHLFRCEELLAYRLATLQNLRFYLRMMEELRLLLDA